MHKCSVGNILDRDPFHDLVRAGHSVSTLDGELDETILTPLSRPRVLNQPVVDNLSGSLASGSSGLTALSASVVATLAGLGSSLGPGGFAACR